MNDRSVWSRIEPKSKFLPELIPVGFSEVMGRGALTRAWGSKMLVTIGKWSVEVGRKEGITSHLVISSPIAGVVKKLSGLEYLLVTIC